MGKVPPVAPWNVFEVQVSTLKYQQSGKYYITWHQFWPRCVSKSDVIQVGLMLSWVNSKQKQTNKTPKKDSYVHKIFKITTPKEEKHKILTFKCNRQNHINVQSSTT